MRSNITNPKTEFYSDYRGSVYCTEQEFGTFYMPSSLPETTRELYPLTVNHNIT